MKPKTLLIGLLFCFALELTLIVPTISAPGPVFSSTMTTVLGISADPKNKRHLDSNRVAKSTGRKVKFAQADNSTLK